MKATGPTMPPTANHRIPGDSSSVGPAGLGAAQRLVLQVW